MKNFCRIFRRDGREITIGTPTGISVRTPEGTVGTPEGTQERISAEIYEYSTSGIPTGYIAR